ncbi:MAG TPA: DUF5996 family protein [Anaeromyxobacteraceae bacterium]|nr:DUF5996 family protein [Anaeromyxobacteraceae bacterium]
MNRAETNSIWPELPLASWRTTRDTLHMWTQIVGKTLLAHCPIQNHWWHTALRVSPRGLVSGSVLVDGRTLGLELDLVDHVLMIRTSEGRETGMPLIPRTVRSFYKEYVSVLRAIDVDAHIWTMPVEIPDPIRFDQDDVHCDYDAEWAHRFWQVLRRCDAALQGLASSFVGKQSPVHFFWGSFDLAATRFSGRRATPRPGADRVTREAYSHEVISFGFWPGGTTPTGVWVDEPLFYAYAAPEPAGFRDANVQFSAARFDDRLGEFVLPYDAVRATLDPAATVRDFFETVYATGASLGHWDRASLERVPERGSVSFPETRSAFHSPAP